MGIKRHKPEKIVTKLRQVEVLVSKEWRGSMLFIRSVSLSKPTIVGANNTAVWEQINSKSLNGSRAA